MSQSNDQDVTTICNMNFDGFNVYIRKINKRGQDKRFQCDNTPNNSSFRKQFDMYVICNKKRRAGIVFGTCL